MCDCMKLIDERLGQHNSRLSVTIMVEAGQMVGRPTIQTEKINPRNRERMGAIATFCPFCGVLYEGDGK